MSEQPTPEHPGIQSPPETPSPPGIEPAPPEIFEPHPGQGDHDGDPEQPRP